MEDNDLNERAVVVLVHQPQGSKLFLGDRIASQNPQYFGITAVVNCASSQVPRHPSIQFYLPLDLYDNMKMNEEDGSFQFDNVAKHFELSGKFIHNALDSGHSVLIHCAGGVSRSTTILVAYLIQHERMTLQEAFQLVKEARPVMAPNAGFVQQLIDLEVAIHQRQTMKNPINKHQRTFYPVEES